MMVVISVADWIGVVNAKNTNTVKRFVLKPLNVNNGNPMVDICDT